MSPKDTEFAPGIPASREVQPIPEIKDPAVWRYVVQKHPAERAGDHYDIRLADPSTGHAHSFATRKDLPAPGERPITVYQQPTHTEGYLDYRGRIESGYGKTKGRQQVKPVVDERAEVLHADDNVVRFNVYTGQGPQEYLLTRDRKRADDKNRPWYLINVTKHKDNVPQNLPFSKPKYKEIAPEAIDFTDSSQVMAAKLDGGHNTIVLDKGKRPRLYSYRVPKGRSTGVIEHSHKIEDLYKARVPKELDGTILRGEVYGKTPDGKGPLPAETVAGMLNASVWKSRQTQKEQGKLQMAVFDVVQYQGKDMSNASYKEKMEALNAVQKHMPQLSVPDMAFTEKEKRQLLRKIKEKKHPETHEGVILWSAHSNEPPIKAKFKSDHDVYVREFVQATTVSGKPKDEVGAFKYSLTPNGPIVGKVGTGFSSKLRKDMWDRPNVYKGAAARVTSLSQYSSGALGKPSFLGWHVDKSSPSFWSSSPVEK